MIYVLAFRPNYEELKTYMHVQNPINIQQNHFEPPQTHSAHTDPLRVSVLVKNTQIFFDFITK